MGMLLGNILFFSALGFTPMLFTFKANTQISPANLKHNFLFNLVFTPPATCCHNVFHRSLKRYNFV